jgi:hypothetical protein
LWFERRDGTFDALTVGTYPVGAVGFDVPEREQGVGGEAPPVGEVTITAAGDGRASGFLTGRGGGFVKSYLTQEDLGVSFELRGLAFRDVPAAWVFGDE